jgi:hypothetical protein
VAQVFISHTRGNADWARSFARALQQKGVTVWFDEFNVRPGESLVEAIESGIRSSDVLVALVDQEPSSLPNLFFEYGAAIGMGKRFVPIVPKDMDPAAVPVELRSRRYLVSDTPEQAAEDLSATLQAA